MKKKTYPDYFTDYNNLALHKQNLKYYVIGLKQKKRLLKRDPYETSSSSIFSNLSSSRFFNNSHLEVYKDILGLRVNMVTNYMGSGEIDKMEHRRKFKKYFLKRLLQDKKKLSSLFGYLKIKNFKSLFRKKYSTSFFKISELRLDVSLVRSRMLPNPTVARLAIKLGYVYINKIICLRETRVLKPMDVVTINPNFFFSSWAPTIRSKYVRMRLKKNSFSFFKNNLKNSFEILRKNALRGPRFTYISLISKFSDFFMKVHSLFLLNKFFIFQNKNYSKPSKKLALRLSYEPGYCYLSFSFKTKKSRDIIKKWLFQKKKNL